MAGYGYQARHSAAYTSPQTDDWSKPSYASDHVCRPVIIDAEGRKRPIVSYSPNQNSEYYVTRTTETIVQEQVVSPFASEIKQTAASRPKFGPMSASTWRQTAKPAGYGSEFNDYNNSDWKKPTSDGYRNDVYDDSYGRYGNNNNNGWKKPSSTTRYREPSSPASIKAAHYHHVDPVLENTFDSSAGKANTYNMAQDYPPNSNLSKPTSDIPEAIEFLKEVAKPFIGTDPRYTKAIDTIEAAKRYGNFGKLNFSPKPYSAGNNY